MITRAFIASKSDYARANYSFLQRQQTNRKCDYKIKHRRTSGPVGFSPAAQLPPGFLCSPDELSPDYAARGLEQASYFSL